MDDDGSWNEDLIKVNFHPLDASAILNSIAGGSGKKDEIIWNCEAKGGFSVRSAYHLASQIQNSKKASSLARENPIPLWRNFWKIKAIPKAKICAWRIIQDSIPTHLNIQKKGIYSNPLCIRCRKFEESTEHALWECKYPKKVWIELIPLTKDLFNLCRIDWKPIDYWEWLSRNLSNEDIALSIHLLWGIWNNRNKILHNSNLPNQIDNARNLSLIIAECLTFKNSNLEAPSELTASRGKSQPSHESWMPPPQGSWKLNVDASWNELQNRGGVGWSMRDSSGSPICSGFRRINKRWSIKLLELRAIVEGLKVLPAIRASRLNLLIPPITVESDALGVVNLLNGEDE